MDQQTRLVNRQSWLERLERFKQANQSITEFCAAEGISVPSFYQWRRKLDPKPKAKLQTAPKFLPVQLPTTPAEKPQTVLSLDLPGGVSVRLEVRHPGNQSS